MSDISHIAIVATDAEVIMSRNNNSPMHGGLRIRLEMAQRDGEAQQGLGAAPPVHASGQDKLRKSVMPVGMAPMHPPCLNRRRGSSGPPGFAANRHGARSRFTDRSYRSAISCRWQPISKSAISIGSPPRPCENSPFGSRARRRPMHGDRPVPGERGRRADLAPLCAAQEEARARRDWADVHAASTESAPSLPSKSSTASMTACFA